MQGQPSGWLQGIFSCVQMPSDSQSFVAPPATARNLFASRLAPCPCGSGRRLKLCCGNRLDQQVAVEQLKQAALSRQHSGELSAAIALYRAVLALTPDRDALHMEAVCHFQAGCIVESAARFRSLLDDWTTPPDAFWTNLNLLVASAAHQPDHALMHSRRNAYMTWQRDTARRKPDDNVSISVVIPSFQHAAYVAQAITSVLAQTRLPDEIIVIDDGSSDNSVAVVREALAGCAVEHRIIARGNCGAAGTLNEAIAMARGEWIAPLNSDDCYAPSRLAALVATCARQGVEWGFGCVDMIDAGGQLLSRRDALSSTLYAVHDSIHTCDSIGLAFLRNNPAISTGNLFFRKSLWQRVGGFAPLRYNHDWQFCQAAALLAEPLLVPDARYRYRWHGGNTIGDSHSAPQQEAATMMRQFVGQIVPTAVDARQPFAPVPQHWGLAFWAMLAAGGHLQVAPRQTLLTLLDRLAQPAPCLPCSEGERS